MPKLSLRFDFALLLRRLRPLVGLNVGQSHAQNGGGLSPA